MVFVVDDLRGPLSEIIYNALVGASDAGYRTVTLPAIRMGVMAGAYEKTIAETVEQAVIGVRKFITETADAPITDITFVIYDDPDLTHTLSRGFAGYLSN